MSEAPGSIPDFLGAAYAMTHGLRDGSLDDLALDLATTNTPTADLIAARDQLQSVQARCVVAHAGRVFLERVLALRG